MFDKLNLSSLFGRNSQGLFNDSHLANVARYHLSFSNRAENKTDSLKAEAGDSEYGFLSDTYRRFAERQVDVYGEEYVNDILRQTAVGEAISSFERDMSSQVSDGTRTLKRMFSQMSTTSKMLGGDSDEDFSVDILSDMTSYLTSDRTTRSNQINPNYGYVNDLVDQLAYTELSNVGSSTQNIVRDLDNFRRDTSSRVASEIDTITGGGYSRSRKLLDNVGYVTRPGILPAVGMAADATQELSIDIFQLQNKSVQDYLSLRLLQEATAFKGGSRNERFKLNVRMASPVGEGKTPFDTKTFDILGPNLMFFRKLEILQEELGDSVDINFSFTDRKNHTKMLVSENAAIVGTQNLTNPIGKSAYQAGSNYEALRVLNYRTDTGLSPDELHRRVMAGEIDPNSLTAETKQYMQARLVMQRTFADKKKFVSTGFENVGGAYETFQHLKSTLDYASSSRGSSSEMSMILNQVFMLKYDRELFDGVRKGEMGPEGDSFLQKNASVLQTREHSYRDLQKKFLNLVIEGRGSAIVDARHYREGVIDPMFNKLRSSGLLHAGNGYDPVRLVREMTRGADTKNRVQVLTNALSAYGMGEDTAIQLLAMTSGNIRQAAVPMQHVKAYNLTEGGTSIAGTLGSSNFGLYSLAQAEDDWEAERVNNEMNLMYASEKVRGVLIDQRAKQTVGYGLTSSENTEELVQFNTAYLRMQSDLGRRGNQIQYLNTSAEWEYSVDKQRLLELEDSIKRLNDITGFDLVKVQRNYDDLGRPIDISVTLDSQSLTGVGGLRNYDLRLTAKLSGSGQHHGFIYAINQNKVIGETEFANTSDIPMMLGLSKGEGKLSVGARSRVVLDPIQTTTAMLSSVALEMMNTSLVKAPYTEFQTRFAGNPVNLQSAVVNYIGKISGYPNLTAQELVNPNNVNREAIIRAALLNIQSRFNSSDNILDRVRSIAGVDMTSAARQFEIDKLTKQLLVFGQNNELGRAKILVGGEPLANFVGQFERMMSQGIFADLTYDFMRAQNDAGYYYDLSQEVRNIQMAAMEPFKTSTQVNTYAYRQAARNRQMYGVSNDRLEALHVMDTAARSEATGIHRLAGMAVLNTPLAFSGVTAFGEGNLVYIPVAEGGGSREVPAAFNYGVFPKMMPRYTHNKIGDVTDLGIIEDAAVGSIVKASDARNYIQKMAALGAGFLSGVQNNLDQLLQTDMLIFNFDRLSKAPQIPQRIKNVIGTRPLADLTLNYQNILDTLQPINFQGQFSGYTGRVATSEQLQAAYLQDLRGALGDKADLVTSEYAVGALYGGKVRRFLTSELAVELEAIRAQLMNEFGLSYEEMQEGPGAELLRVRLLRQDLSYASMMRGFIGSSERFGKPAVMMMQMAGAYSDYYYANPMFGGEAGMRVGFMDRAVKNTQASKLRATISTADMARALGVDSWSFDQNLMATSGEVLKFDPLDGRTHVYRYDENTGSYVKSRSVDSRNEFAVLGNIIDRFSATPSFSYVTATSAAASLVPEDARETLRHVRILNPGNTGNNIEIELVFDRTLKQGGGRRSEVMSGGLFKGVPIFLQKDFFSRVAEQTSRSGAWANYETDLRDIQGLANPSNFKSYMFSHGATLLTYNGGSMFGDLLKHTDSRTLAASLLMGVGLSHAEMESDPGKEALRSLVRQAASGNLGKFYQSIALQVALQKGSSDEITLAKEMLKEINKDRGGADLQMPSLRYISLSDISSALNGENEIIKDKLGTFFHGIGHKEYLENDMVGRERALLAGSLDLYSQLASTSSQNLGLVDIRNDRHAFMTLGSIAGFSYEELINDDGSIAEILNYRANYSQVLKLFVPVSGSQSKVAVSSRNSGRIELQHIMPASFTTQVKQFQSQGSAGAMRNLMSIFLGAMTEGSSQRYFESTSKLEMFDVTSRYVRSPFFKSRALGFYDSPIADEAKFSALRRQYNFYATLQLFIDSTPSFGEEETALLNQLIDKSRLGKDTTKQLKELAKAGDILGLQALASTGFTSTMTDLENMSIQYNLYANKASGIDYQEAVASGLNKSGWKRMAFSFPAMQIQGNTVKIHKDRLNYSFALSGEDMKILGQQFGSFESEEGKMMLSIVQAFVEGSSVSNVFDRISNLDDGVNSLELSLEEAESLKTWQENALNFPTKLLEAFGGERLSQVLGNKLGFEGGTFTAAAMFGVPMRSAIVPEYISDKFGGAPPTARVRALDALEKKILGAGNAMGVLNSKIRESNKEYRLLNTLTTNSASSLRFSMLAHSPALYSVTANQALKTASRRKALFEKRNKLRQHQELYMYQMSMLEIGISAGAKGKLSNLVKASEEYRRRIEEADTDVALTSIFDEVTKRLKEQGDPKLRTSGPGDHYAKLAWVAEMQILQSEALSRLSVRPDNYSEYSKRAHALKKTGTVIDGLMLGSTANTNLGKISLDALEGDIRKGSKDIRSKLGLEKMELNQQNLQGAIGQIRNIINGHRAEVVRQGAEELYNYSESARSIDAIASRLDKWEAQLKRAHTQQEMEDIRMFLDSDTARLGVELGLTRAQIWRSPPPGNYALDKSKFTVFKIGDLNRMFADRAKDFGYEPIQLDESRNQTLGLFNPISFLVSQLGDFDGDSVTAIWDYSDRLKIDVEGKKNLLRSLQDKKRSMKQKMPDQSHANYQTELENLQKLEKRIADIKQDIRDTETTLNRTKSNYAYSEFEDSARKWVANYLKIDERFFISKKNGGFSNTKENVDIGTLFTFIEQGRGLFGGMEDIADAHKETYKALMEIGQDRSRLETADRFDQFLTSLDPSNQVAQLIRNNPNLSEEVRTALIESHANERGYSVGVGMYVSSLATMQSGSKEAQKYLGRGHGTLMNPDQFDMMLKTLSQAGGMILGKMYNSTIGLVMADSPIMAVSHAIKTDPSLREALVKHIGAEGVAELDKYSDRARATSEFVGGFIQATHQLMRDSIKPKQAASFFKELDEELENYRLAKSEAEKTEVIDRIALKFGPGAGLKGVVQLERLVSNVQTLNASRLGVDQVAQQTEILEKQFGIYYEREIEISKRLGFDFSQETGKFSTSSKLQEANLPSRGRRALVAAYKTKQDLLHLVSAFAFEKTIGDLKGAKSSGKTAVSLINEESIAAMMGHADSAAIKSQADAFVRAADSIFSPKGDIESTTFSIEESEYKEYISTLYNPEKEGDDYRNLSKDEKFLSALTYIKTRSQMEPFAGRYGEGLVDVAHFNQVRSQAYAGELRAAGGDWELTKDSAMMSMMMAAGSDKLGPENVSKFAESIVLSYKNATGSNQVTEEQVLSHLLGMGGLNKSTDSRLVLEQVQELVRKDPDGVGKQLWKSIQATAFGQMNSTVKEFAENTAMNDYMQKAGDQALHNVFVKAGATEKGAQQMVNHLQASLANALASGESTPIEHFLSNFRHQAQRGFSKPQMTDAQTFIQEKVLTKNADVGFDAFAIPMLGILGQALASGEVTPENFQEAMGNSLTALAYSRSSFGNLNLAGKGAVALSNAAIGTGFKMRMALEENEGDTGKAVVSLVSRELTMQATAMIGTQAITPAIHRALGGGPNIDFDKYDSLRGITSNVIGSVAATLLGMYLGEQSSRAVRAASSFEPSMVEASLKAAQKEILKLSQMGMTAETDGTVEVEGDDGIVQYIEYQVFAGDPEANSATAAALFSEDITNEDSFSSIDESLNDSYSYTLGN